MEIELRDASMRFGSFTAVHPTNLIINPGEFFSILGPSGCGKTTILRMVSGFLNPTSGDILIGGESMLGKGPDKRPTALIFQNLALFPLMKIRENVAFGLEMRGMSKSKREDKAQELLDLVALGDQGDKLPAELSGGQRQRVAIARALAVEPAVLLLDEPLSALDLKLRQHMRTELREIQRKTGVTFIYITHDQGEALTMSDRIAVMKAGVVEQVGTSDYVYETPQTSFAATFVGANNILRGKITERSNNLATVETKFGTFSGCNPKDMDVGSEAMLFVRPEKTHILKPGTVAQNVIAAKYERRDLEGPFVNLHFRRDEDTFSIHQTNVDLVSFSNGEEYNLWFEPQASVILPVGEVADE
jgi:spermidine/putrescine transport system ATP-binding protein